MRNRIRNRIFSTDSAKAIKAQGHGYLNAIHYMAPHTLGGVGNLCPHASAGCRALCLGHYSGQASMVHDLERDDNEVRASRRTKAMRFMRERSAYMRDVVRCIEAEQRRADRLGMRLCVRMNGSTDIAWESIKCERNGVAFASVFAAFPEVQFVDYTKNPRRMLRPLPSNYHLTFSRSETNERDALDVLRHGRNVAIVFASDKPNAWMGYPIVDGDTHDLRHLDPSTTPTGRGHVIALSPKGIKAKRDLSGFVVR